MLIWRNETEEEPDLGGEICYGTSATRSL